MNKASKLEKQQKGQSLVFSIRKSKAWLLLNINYQEQLFWQSKGFSQASLSVFIPWGKSYSPS